MENLRENYIKHALTEDSILASPFEQFQVWFGEATHSQVQEPNAMALATATPDGRTAVRMVLLKGFSAEQGFVFYTNYQSRKGHDLLINPAAALLFWWPPLERQVRIEGKVVIAPAEISDAYFRSRPAASRLGAIASPQSEVIASRDALEERYKQLQEEFPFGNMDRPEHWGGYLLQPQYFEFWQGRSSRLHDRIAYTPQEGGAWLRQRLAP
ncbi:pyridoxamine 5'-phosphate oxidase [soil metagenome]